MINCFEPYFTHTMYNLLPNHNNFKTLGQFENLVCFFYIMSKRENIRLIATKFNENSMEAKSQQIFTILSR